MGMLEWGVYCKNKMRDAVQIFYHAWTVQVHSALASSAMNATPCINSLRTLTKRGPIAVDGSQPLRFPYQMYLDVWKALKDNDPVALQVRKAVAYHWKYKVTRFDRDVAPCWSDKRWTSEPFAQKWGIVMQASKSIVLQDLGLEVSRWNTFLAWISALIWPQRS